MNHVIRGRNISEAWKQAVVYLTQNENESYNLIAEIERPIEDETDVRAELNNILSNQGDQSVETVANTIFPAQFETNRADRNELYDRFLRLYPQLRQIPENSKGTYFGRLTCWGFETRANFNQVEQTIRKLISARGNKSRIRVRYEMGIYDPIQDHNSLMGFPCMSFISIKIRQNAIDLTAIYRNQFFVQKAYGNYLGLGRLLDFIARHSGFELGRLTCIATHAAIGNINRENFVKLRELCASVEQMNMEF